MTGYLIIGALGALVLAITVVERISLNAIWRRVGALERNEQLRERGLV